MSETNLGTIFYISQNQLNYGDTQTKKFMTYGCKYHRPRNVTERVNAWARLILIFQDKLFVYCL